MAKVCFVTWPTTIYIAAKSIQEFESIISKHKKKNVTYGYWPVLEKSEGYWLSPFSSTNAIKRVIAEIKSHKNKNKIMWDAEFPFRHPWFFLRCGRYFRNMFLIKKFFQQNGKYIYTSEYAIRNTVSEFLLKIMGVSFSPQKYKNKKIIMYYTSMHKSLSHHLLRNIQRLHQTYGEMLHIGLGTIATGILGEEPILSPRKLEKDLQNMKKIGIHEVVIFRLGGLNKEYSDVLRKFL
ncbi:hypothetical protein COV17_01265 [Candidatus Woesearchaeota archaeon CG10_big_fil_rev_8_21_14_0_10_36_11]|nr:MAG: hypothetical protein COV17_01265 [Candidatus Woesearchaeota archaeon CG10_big_fil_rev_8_21_14_0_10_36_11]